MKIKDKVIVIFNRGIDRETTVQVIEAKPFVFLIFIKLLRFKM